MLWLAAPDSEDDDEKDAADAVSHDSQNDDDPCDEEGWYWFGSDGKMYKDAKQKKINGKYYYFNNHGQMLYEWINGVKANVLPMQNWIAIPSKLPLLKYVT